MRQSIKQFYKRGRDVVSGLLHKHSFDTVFVWMTSHYLDALVSLALFLRHAPPIFSCVTAVNLLRCEVIRLIQGGGTCACRWQRECSNCLF